MGLGKNRIKNRKRLVIISGITVILLAAVVILLISQGGAASLLERIQGNGYDKPEKLLGQYYSYIGKEKYEEMYRMLEEDSRADISSEEFVSRNKKIYEGIEADNIKVKLNIADDSKKDETVISYELTMDTLAGPVSFTNQAVFKEQDQGKYRYGLKWDDSMIFPDLASDDKVQVTESEAKRGSILDRNGRVLAGNGTASSVGLVPGKMNSDSSGDITRLAEILGISTENIEKKLLAEWVKEDSFVPIKTVEKLTQLEHMSSGSDEKVIQKTERDAALLSIPGVMLSDTEIRQYPLGAAGSHLTGYIQKVTAEDLEQHQGEGYGANSMIGRSGMEGLFEKELKGKNGYRIAIVDQEGNEKSVPASAAKQDGTDVTLTIDSELQQTIYDNFAEDKSCSVAMNPYTGEVLALVSAPSFNSNDIILGMSDELWNSLNESEGKPLYNRYRQKLCPGSSFKPVTAAIGLKTGAVNPQEDYGNVGLSWQKDSSWGDYYVTTLHAYDPVILENALIYSDNIYFAKTALKIGKDALQAELHDLGFNKKLPFDISVEESQYSNTDNIESEIQLADSGYGQGQILVNPIHLAALYTGFANSGNILKPYLLYQEEPKSEIWLNTAYRPEHAELIKNAMGQVVQSVDGTGHGAYREDITLAGKTGTAEIKLTKEDQSGTELGWFGVFTTDPGIEKPVLLLSMAEDVKDRGGSGYVVEKDRQILDNWFSSGE